MPKSIPNKDAMLKDWVVIKFKGWEFDAYLCADGSLGITVNEFGKSSEEAEFIDIIINKKDVHDISSC